MTNEVFIYIIVALWHLGMCDTSIALTEQYPCSVPNCIQCDHNDSSVCSDCSQFYALHEGWCYWCPSTPHTTDISKCPLCKSSCINCDMFSGECLSCIPGYQLQLLSIQQTDCQRCSVDNCAECNTTETCQDCLRGFTLINGACAKCQVEGCENCDSDPGRCDDCGDGFTFSGRQNVCRSVNVQCQVGQFYSIDDRKCPPCMDGCLQCPNAESCYQCAPGYYQPLLDKTTLYQDCYKCSDNCAECQFNSQYCTGCKDGQIPFQGLCYVSCERNNSSAFCRSGIDTQLQVAGKGYGTRYLSPTHDISFIFNLKSSNYSDRLDLEDVICSLNKRNLSQPPATSETQEFKFDNTPLRVSASSFYSQSVLFSDPQLAGDQVLNLTCISYFLDNHMGFTMRDTVVFRTIPTSSGQFRIKQVNDNQFLITIDGFDPKIPGLAEKVHQNYYRLYVNQMCNIDPTRSNDYMQAPIWEFSSNDYVYSKKYSYTSRVSYDTCIRFSLRVSNDFLPEQVFHSRVFNVTPMGSDASIEYYIEKLLAEPNGQQIQKIYEGVERKIILSASDYCKQGKLNITDQTCDCMSIQPSLMYNKIQKNIIDLMTATQRLKNKEKDPIQLYETITNLMTYLTNDTCSLQDDSFIQQIQSFMTHFMNISTDYISQKTAINLILTNINIYQGLTAQLRNKSRILQRLQIQENILETLPTLGDLKLLIYQDIWKSIQRASFKFNFIDLLHGGFKISTRFLEYNKPIEFQIFLTKQISIRVPIFALSSLFRLGKDQYTFACLVGNQLPFQRDQGMTLYGNKFVEPQFFSQRRGQLYPQTDSRFLLTISFFDSQLTGFETCFIYLDKKWSTTQVKSNGKRGQVTCAFTTPDPIALNTILPAPLTDLYKKQNQSVGLVNLIIMTLLYLVFAGYAFKAQEPLKSVEPQRESIKNFLDDEKQQPKPKLQRRPSIELYFPEAQQTLKKEELQVNHGPVIIEYDGQSQQKIITKPEEPKTAFSNTVCNLSGQYGTRVALIFLWISQYQWVFVAFMNSPTFKDNNVQIFFQLSIITLIMSNFVNYLYAMIVYSFYRILNRSKKSINFTVTLLFLLNLIFVVIFCSLTDHEDLSIYHACNLVFQIFFNMGLFDCYCEFLSQKLVCLGVMRKFKVLNFN